MHGMNDLEMFDITDILVQKIYSPFESLLQEITKILK